MNRRVFSHIIVLLLTVKKRSWSPPLMSLWFCFPHSTRIYGCRGEKRVLNIKQCFVCCLFLACFCPPVFSTNCTYSWKLPKQEAKPEYSIFLLCFFQKSLLQKFPFLVARCSWHSNVIFRSIYYVFPKFICFNSRRFTVSFRIMFKIHEHEGY